MFTLNNFAGLGFGVLLMGASFGFGIHMEIQEFEERASLVMERSGEDLRISGNEADAFYISKDMLRTILKKLYDYDLHSLFGGPIFAGSVDLSCARSESFFIYRCQTKNA